jgi:hypothetical protein
MAMALHCIQRPRSSNRCLSAPLPARAATIESSMPCMYGIDASSRLDVSQWSWLDGMDGMGQFNNYHCQSGQSLRPPCRHPYTSYYSTYMRPYAHVCLPVLAMFVSQTYSYHRVSVNLGSH